MGSVTIKISEDQAEHEEVVNTHVWSESVIRHQCAHHWCSEHSHNCWHTESGSLSATGTEERSRCHRELPLLTHTISRYQAGSRGDKS